MFKTDNIPSQSGRQEEEEVSDAFLCQSAHTERLIPLVKEETPLPISDKGDTQAHIQGGDRTSLL
jgi:hypothetical protein